MMRLAWRDIRAHWGRSLAAVILFALPVAFFASFTTLIGTSLYLEEHPENSITYAQTSEPPGPGFSPVFRGYVAGSANDQTTNLWVTALPPSAANEHLSVPPAGTIDLPIAPARALGVDIGDTITVEDVSLKVHDLHYHQNAIANHADFSSFDSNWWAVEHEPPASYLALDKAQPMPPSIGEILWQLPGWDLVSTTMLLSLFAVIVIVTAGLATPLFTVAHTRMRSTIDLLTQTGARRRWIRRLFLAEGLILASVGAVIGLLAAWAISEATMQYLLDIPARWDWAAAVLFAILSLLSAAVSSQLPLIGRQFHRPPRWLAFPGPLLVLAGFALLYENNVGIYLGFPVIVLGSALSGVTAVFILGSLTSRLPAISAMATRDVVRHFRRSSAAIGAIALAALGVISVGLVSSTFISDNELVNEGTVATPETLVSSPAGFEPTLRHLSEDFGPRIDIFTADQSITTNGTLAWYPIKIYEEEIIAPPEFIDYLAIPEERKAAAKAKLNEGIKVTHEDLRLKHPGSMISPNMASTEQLTYKGSFFPQSPSPWQMIQLHRQSQRSGMEIAAANEESQIQLMIGAILALGALFVLGLMWVILALTRFESRREQRQLTEIGAGPSALRRFRITQILAIVLPGGIISTAVALLIWQGGPS